MSDRQLRQALGSLVDEVGRITDHVQADEQPRQARALGVLLHARFGPCPDMTLRALAAVLQRTFRSEGELCKPTLKSVFKALLDGAGIRLPDDPGMDAARLARVWRQALLEGKEFGHRAGLSIDLLLSLFAEKDAGPAVFDALLSVLVSRKHLASGQALNKRGLLIASMRLSKTSLAEPHLRELMLAILRSKLNDKGLAAETVLQHTKRGRPREQRTDPALRELLMTAALNQLQRRGFDPEVAGLLGVVVHPYGFPAIPSRIRERHETDAGFFFALPNALGLTAPSAFSDLDLFHLARITFQQDRALEDRFCADLVPSMMEALIGSLPVSELGFATAAICLAFRAEKVNTVPIAALDGGEPELVSIEKSIRAFLDRADPPLPPEKPALVKWGIAAVDTPLVPLRTRPKGFEWLMRLYRLPGVVTEDNAEKQFADLLADAGFKEADPKTRWDVICTLCAAAGPVLVSPSLEIIDDEFQKALEGIDLTQLLGPGPMTADWHKDFCTFSDIAELMQHAHESLAALYLNLPAWFGLQGVMDEETEPTAGDLMGREDALAKLQAIVKEGLESAPKLKIALAREELPDKELPGKKLLGVVLQSMQARLDAAQATLERVGAGIDGRDTGSLTLQTPAPAHTAW